MNIAPELKLKDNSFSSASYHNIRPRKHLKLQELLKFFHIFSQLPAVITMQAHWRGFAQYKKYNDRLQYFRDNEEFIIKVNYLLSALCCFSKTVIRKV